jgi:hypothetical protein
MYYTILVGNTHGKNYFNGSEMAQLIWRLRYWPDDREIWIRFPAAAEIFLFHGVQVDSGPTQLSGQ